MRYPWIGGLAWAGVWILTTAATSAEGTRQAREWQHAAAMAAHFEQWDIAHAFYQKAAETYPATSHGQFCTERANDVEDVLLKVDGTPGSERRKMGRDELIDFFTWP